LLSLAGGSSSAQTIGHAIDLPTRGGDASHQLMLSDEEVSDVSLATFYVFDKENTASGRPGLQLTRGGCGGCGGRGCGCGGCGGRGCGCLRGCGGCGGCAALGLGIGLGLLGLAIGGCGGCGGYYYYGGCGGGTMAAAVVATTMAGVAVAATSEIARSRSDENVWTTIRGGSVTPKE
jgi:hypothetical protein